MKTPSPQEAAKTEWAEEIADEICDDALDAQMANKQVCVCDSVKKVLLEAREQGFYDAVDHYEPLRAEDTELLRACFAELSWEHAHEGFEKQDRDMPVGQILKKLKERLAPSVGLSEGKQ